MFKKSLILLTIVSFVFASGGDCREEGSKAVKKQRSKTKQLHEEAYRQVGMPNITNFQELRLMKKIMELRDRQLSTYSYTVDRDGHLHFLCPSLGYGLPYSTQMTSPEKFVTEHGPGFNHHGHTSQGVPQPEPNGLYMPDNVSATWVLCQNPKDGGVAPVYSEPELIVSPFPLEYENKYAEEDDVETVISGQ
jgi:hypothetical protein